MISLEEDIARVFPELFAKSDEREMRHQLPALKWTHKEGEVSIYFVAPQQLHMERFFYDLITRWIAPGHKVEVPFFYSSEWVLSAPYIYIEMRLRLPREVEFSTVDRTMRILGTEIRLGMVSIYHASRLLELPGRAMEPKSLLIHDKITALLQRWPEAIDYDIYGDMQQFFVLSCDEFRAVRSPHHLSRLIALFYLFRRRRDKKVSCKVAPIDLDFPWGLQRAVGIAVGLSSLHEKERFEEKHLLQAVQSIVPEAKVVEGSFFSLGTTFYVEVIQEKEMANLKKNLPREILHHIEIALNPLFKPRNEEEVLRTITQLARELKFVRDTPQLALLFDEQTEEKLSYDVIIVRPCPPGSIPIADFFAAAGSFLKCTVDRIRTVGLVRKRYPKEATVFRVEFPKAPFVREDQWVDLFRARQAVVAELQRVLGQLRDYSGGMIARQIDLLAELKKFFPSSEELLVERFFHALYPIEMRSICPVLPLKKLFTLWRQGAPATLEEDVVYKLGEGEIHFEAGENELLVAKLEGVEKTYFGYIYFGKDPAAKKAFLDQKAEPT